MIEGKPLILVADDDTNTLNHYEDALIQFGFESIDATSLEELERKFNKYADEIDVIILDGCIPGDELNTISFIQYVREAGFDGPIIAASSHPGYRRRMVAAGATHNEEKESAADVAFLLMASYAS